METMETEVQVKEAILISEETLGTGQLKAQAQSNCDLLNSLANHGLRTEAEILEAGSKRKAFIMDRFYERFPQAKEQSKYSKLEFVLPLELIQLDSLLSQITVHSFKYVHAKRKEWQIDQEDLAQACKRYQKWARSEAEISRWRFALAYVDYIKNQIQAGELSQKRFSGEIMVYHPSKGFQPNPDFVFNSYKF